MSRPFDEQLGRLMDGEASAAEIDELLAQVQAAPELEVELREQLQTAEWLTHTYDQVRDPERFCAALQVKLRAWDVADAPAASVGPDRSAPRGQTESRAALLRRLTFSSTTYSLLTSSSIIVGLLFLLAIWSMPHGRNNSSDRPQKIVAATIINTHQAVWAEHQSAGRPGDRVRAGAQLELREGLAEIGFAKGAVVVLRGPAELKVIDPASARLLRGQLVARAEGAAKGFTVHTTDAAFIDLGTEFGVEVELHGTQLHVYQGAVAVLQTQAGGASSRHVAQAGEGFIVARQTLQPAPPELAERFVHQLPQTTPSESPLSAYARRVLAHQPVLYYRMEPVDGAILFDSGSASRHVSFRQGGAAAPLWTEGAFGRAAQFRGPAFGDHAVVSSYPKAEQNQLTVSAWVWAENRPTWATIAKNWPRYGQFHLGFEAETGALAMNVGQADGTPVTARETTPFPLRSWQHVALVVDGREARLYRNGRQVAAVACRGLKPESFTSPLGIGVKPYAESRLPLSDDVGYWHGRIDELAIFYQALTPEQIIELADPNPEPAIPSDAQAEHGLPRGELK